MKDVVKSGAGAQTGEVKKHKVGRDGGIAGYCAVAFVFVSMIVLVLCLTVFFKVKMVEINGVSLYREDQIVGVGGIVNDENLVRTDTKLIEKRLKENLVFIETAEVTKKYPSTLIINITEAEKAADILLENGKFCTVSKTGRVLELGNDAQTADIPLIKGFELANEKVGETLKSKDDNKLRIYNEIIKIIRAIGFDKVTEIDLSSRSGIVLMYDNRISMEIGSSVDLDYKLNYFKSVIDNKLTGEFRGRMVYNGADSGISAIPEGAGVKNNDDSSEADTDKKTDDNGNEKNDANADNNANTNANTDNGNQMPGGIEDYGYMQNEKRNENAANTNNNAGNADNNAGNTDNNGGYDPNANAGYDPNANAGYDPNANTGYDPNANAGYDPNAYNGGDYNNGDYPQYNYQP